MSLPRFLLLALCLSTTTNAGVLEDLGYNPKNSVDEELGLALDLAAMRTSRNDFQAKKDIYTGKNKNGLSLQDLSLNAQQEWGDYPPFLIYKAGFDLLGQTVEGDTEGFFDGKEIRYYADTLVNDLFLLNVTNIEAEAALAVNVYMAFCGSLFDIITGCKANDVNKMHLGLDKAAAYWVGAEQIRGDSATGYFFYNLAQFVGDRFNQFANDDPEVIVNTNVITELLLLQADIDGDKCTSGDGSPGYRQMRTRVKTLISYANQVLMQMLLHRIKTYPDGQPTDFVELYSLALLPQIAACDSDLFNTILKYTVSLNVDDTTEAPLIEALQQSLSCLGLTCDQVGSYEVNLIPACSEVGVLNLAGYEPQNHVRLESRIDRDIRQIRWFMQFSAFSAAWDWYSFGWNTFFSLQEMARGETVSRVGPTYEMAADYYVDISDTDFIDDIVTDIIEGSGTFGSATDKQLQEYLDSLLKGTVMFLGITNELENAVESAKAGDWDEAQRSWDQGAALFIGSTEGPHVGGSQAAPGESIYGVANDQCKDFNVCGADGISQVSEDIFFGLTTGSSLIQGNSDAVSLEELVQLTILPNLIIPSLQGMLSSAIEAGEEGSGSTYVGREYGFSRAVLGYYWENAVQVANINDSVNTSPDPADTDAMFISVQDILAEDAVQTDCVKVGNIRGSDNVPRGLCKGVPPDAPVQPGDTPAPNLVPPPTPAPVPITRPPSVTEKPVPPTHSQGLAWGRFNFHDDILANLDGAVAYDVKSMWASTDLSTSKQVYLNGLNFTDGLYGMSTVTSLSKMSTEASTVMAEDTIYNFYRYAMYESDRFDDLTAQDEIWSFADEVVNMALEPSKGNSPVLAAEAAVVLNSFFIILRQLNEATRECAMTNDFEALRFLDSAVAIWIGAEQGEKKFNSGYMMYSQAQLAWSYLRQPESEAPSNTKLMDLFNNVQTAAQTCSTDTQGSTAKMRMLTKQIAKYLTVPMVQQLLYYLGNDDRNFVELFSVAFVPQIVGCSAGDFAYLRGQLIQASFFDSGQDDQTEVLQEIAAGLACLGITCEDLGDAANAQVQRMNTYFETVCKQLEIQYDSEFLAGYDTDTPVGEISKLDLDIHRIDILMQTKAVGAAQNIYENGYSSLSDDGTSFRSLKNLLSQATSDKTEGTLASLYSVFFFNDNYPDEFVTDIFTGAGDYETASRLQQAVAVRRMLQAAGTYLAIFAFIDQAQSTCAGGGDGGMYVDQAAALFVGSIEGTISGGSASNSGTMLMALGKETCSAFDKCESNGDSTVNEFILFAFSDIKQWLSTNDCDSASAIRNETLLPMLSVPIIQATLWFASLSEPLSAASDDSELAALDVFGKTILPQVETINSTSAATLDDNTEFDALSDPVPDGTAAVFEAFTYVVRGLGIDCDIIGTLQSLDLSTCNSTIVAPHPDTPTTLGKNTSIYKSTTYVQNFADIAVDVKKMEEELSLGRKDIPQLIYKEGENSPVYDKYGIKVNLRSLSSFSTNASNTMKQNPLYQTTVYALEDESGNYMGKPATQYADSIVLEAFTKPGTLAAEAAVILNLWMETANELYASLEDCKNQQVEDDQGIHQMDKVAAYWIGDGETAGNKEEGHLLYNLAERMAATFGTVDESGQATVNLKFLRLLNQARLDLSFPQSCSEDLTTARKLQRTVTRIVAQMITLQVQGLINSILKNDRDRTRIFAHGFVPLVKACSEHTFDFLSRKLIPADYSETEIDALVGRIYSVLSCFEIECADIGTHQETETGAVCEDPAFMAPLAGYRPSADVVDYATLDLDISLIEILMKREAYGVARDVYMFGKHSAAGADGTTSLSLQSLAKSTRRATIPDYNAYVQYFASDNNFADTMILNAFDSQDMEPFKREAVVVGTSQYIIMYMGIQEQMYESVRECKSGGRQAAAELLWNKAAAYIIGSIEGPVDEPYSQNQGVFLWGLAKKLCATWGTCNNIITGSTAVNDRTRELLYTGRGAVKAGSCEALEKAAGEITPLLRAPLIQASLTEILETGRHGAGETRDIHHARAYVATEAILPLIQQHNQETATMIKTNLDFEGDALAPDGAVVVAKGITDSISALGVSCEYIGGTSQVNTCTGEVTPEESNRLPLVIGLGAGAFAGALVAFLLFYCYNKKRSRTPEQPKFVRNQKGVMDEADQDFDPAGSLSRGGATMDDMDEADASNAERDEFLDVELPEAV